MILAITGTCSDPGLEVILYVIRRFMTLVQIVGPILCIISLAYTFVMLVTNPDDKKLIGRLKNSAIALVVLFLLPFVVDLAIQVIGEGSEFNACWTEAKKPKSGTPTYQKVDDIGGTSSSTSSDSKSDSTSSDTKSKSKSKSKTTVDTSDKSKVYNRPGSGVW